MQSFSLQLYIYDTNKNVINTALNALPDIQIKFATNIHALLQIHLNLCLKLQLNFRLT